MELIKADIMKHAFQSMFNLYAHELSAYNPWIGSQIDSNGNFLADSVKEYLSDRYSSYCITDNNIPIGMVVFFSEQRENVWYHVIEEIFIVKTSRHKGIAESISKDFWKSKNGIGTLSVLPDNKGAVSFWNKLIESCGYSYTVNDSNGMIEYSIKLN